MQSEVNFTGMKLKVFIAARPDHSIFLFARLTKIVSVQLATFNVRNRHTKLINIINLVLKSRIKKVHDQAIVLETFTILNVFLTYFCSLFNLEYRLLEYVLSNYFYSRVLNKLDYNVLHYWPSYINPMGLKLVKNNKCKTLCDIHSAHPKFVLDFLVNSGKELLNTHLSYEVKYKTKYYIEESNFVLPSKYVLDSYGELFNEKKVFINPYRFSSIDNAIHRHNEAKLKKSKINNKLILVYAGSVTVEKGIDWLIDVLCEFPGEITLRICGIVPKEQKHHFRDRLSMDYVEFLGPLSKNELFDVFTESDLYVHPSLSDAYSLSVCEALVHCCPGIVSNRTGSKDDISQFEVGEIFECFNRDDLFNKIQRYNCSDYYSKRIEKITEFLKVEEVNGGYHGRMLEIYKTILSVK